MMQQRFSLIYAHRGANKEAAENTRSAFDKALQYAIDGMETDVQLSRDEVPVLWHDTFLTKLGLAGKHVDDYDYAQLSTMDFSSHFSPDTKGEGIMSLQDFMDDYRKRCRLILEIKNRDWEASYRHHVKMQKVLSMVGTTAPDSALIISSFHLASLTYAHKCKPEFPLVYNMEAEHTVTDAEQAITAQPFLHGLCLHISTLSEAMVRLLRAHGKSVTVYTCNTDAEINKALELGVDILISDFPQKALRLRELRQQRS